MADTHTRLYNQARTQSTVLIQARAPWADHRGERATSTGSEQGAPLSARCGGPRRHSLLLEPRVRVRVRVRVGVGVRVGVRVRLRLRVGAAPRAAKSRST